jgi:hypothetical protein
VATRPTTLRKMLDEGSPLTLQFNLSGGFADAANALHSSNTTNTRSTVGQSQGQVSAFGLRPYTLEERFQMIKRMIDRGDMSLAGGVSFDTVKEEMRKPENDGMAVKDMVSRLAAKKLLKMAAPKVELKVKAPAPSFRM